MRWFEVWGQEPDDILFFAGALYIYIYTHAHIPGPSNRWFLATSDTSKRLFIDTSWKVLVCMYRLHCLLIFGSLLISSSRYPVVPGEMLPYIPGPMGSMSLMAHSAGSFGGNLIDHEPEASGHWVAWLVPPTFHVLSGIQDTLMVGWSESSWFPTATPSTAESRGIDVASEHQDHLRGGPEVRPAVRAFYRWTSRKRTCTTIGSTSKGLN